MIPVYTDIFDTETAAILRDGGVGVLRTDTLYGIVARADSETAVERVYRIKGRTPSKPPIILIGSIDQLLNKYPPKIHKRLAAFWPGKNSVILDAPNAPGWLLREGGSLAYRFPNDSMLQDFLRITGPLIAPSANPEGDPPAMNVSQARAYFGDKVDFYIDGGEVLDATPSKLYRLQPDGLERLR